jgi:hypothetical protein
VKVHALFLALASLLLLAGCGKAVAPVGSGVAPATGGQIETLVCRLPDGSGAFTATGVISSTAGWYVMGVITVSVIAGEVFTIAGPAGIAPEIAPACAAVSDDR